VTLTMVHPGGAPNTYVPSTEATHNMIVDFSRNPNSFALNKWLYIVPVTKMVGLYTKMTVEEAGRLLSATGLNRQWPLGNDAPEHRGELEKFDFPKYGTKRYNFGFRIPQETAQEAAWDIIAQHSRIVAQQAMTMRTQNAVTLVQTAGNWPTNNTIDVDSIATMGGAPAQWDVSTTARLSIKKSLTYGLQTIQKETLGGIKLSDVKLVIGPDTAAGMAQSQEIADFVKGSPDALKYLNNELGPNALYGLPQYLYGVEIILEDAVKTASRKGASSITKSYVWDGDKACLLYRAGGTGGKGDSGMVGPEDSNAAPTFSTVTCFMKEEMTVENVHDVNNRVNKGRIVENYDMQMTAGVSGFLFTDVLT